MSAAGYTHILVAVDFSPSTDPTVQRAVELTRRYAARLSFIHVVEYLPVAMDAELMLPPMAGVEEQLMESARKRLQELAEKAGMKDAAQYVELGSTKLEILRVAQDRKPPDPIKVTSSRILASTKAKCASRIRSNTKRPSEPRP